MLLDDACFCGNLFVIAIDVIVGGIVDDSGSDFIHDFSADVEMPVGYEDQVNFAVDMLLFAVVLLPFEKLQELGHLYCYACAGRLNAVCSNVLQRLTC